jgi:hypothetical protein
MLPGYCSCFQECLKGEYKLESESFILLPVDAFRESEVTQLHTQHQ